MKIENLEHTADRMRKVAEKQKVDKTGISAIQDELYREISEMKSFPYVLLNQRFS